MTKKKKVSKKKITPSSDSASKTPIKFKKTQDKQQLASTADNHIPLKIQESKFYTGPETATISAPAPRYEFHDLPQGYNDTLIIVQVRDPYWAHTYWEISKEKRTEVELKYSMSLDNVRRLLRVYDVTNIKFNGTNANSYFDIEINSYANNWYINLGNPGRSFCVDLAVIAPNGEFVVLARSNTVTSPLDGPSNITDEEWMIVEDDFNRLYGMAVGLGIGLSSGELKQRLKEKMRLEITSGGVSSLSVSSPVKKMERGFWLVANTELIVYGATEPNAKLKVQNRPVALRPDGTFTLRFALPDGGQVIPIQATSFDDQEKRQITFKVEKKTE